MPAASVPEEGELHIGPVSLPAGRRVHAGFESRLPVAWVTRQPVPEAGRVWAALSDAHQQTGLVPFLLGTLPGEPGRPWDSEEFACPADPARLAGMDAAGLLRQWWYDRTREVDAGEEDEEFVEYIREALAPFSPDFPGLAPAGDTALTSAECEQVLDALPPARIGLVPADRPADVLPLIGWIPSDQLDDALPVAAVVRSWEERFGARLLQVGFSEFTLLVSRPPRSIGHAQRVAAEHFSFCDECANHTGLARTTIPEIAPVLAGAPLWSFWWD